MRDRKRILTGSRVSERLGSIVQVRLYGQRCLGWVKMRDGNELDTEGETRGWSGNLVMKWRNGREGLAERDSNV